MLQIWMIESSYPLDFFFNCVPLTYPTANCIRLIKWINFYTKNFGLKFLNFKLKTFTESKLMGSNVPTSFSLWFLNQSCTKDEIHYGWVISRFSEFFAKSCIKILRASVGLFFFQLCSKNLLFVLYHVGEADYL